MSSGKILLFGSGETLPRSQSIYNRLFSEIDASIRVAILETPAGFEPNSSDVAGNIGKYLEKHLQNFHPKISLIPVRKRGTAFSPDDPTLLEQMYDANVLFIGPGSPTYTVRQLRNSVTWDSLRASHRLGSALVMASAAVLAVSTYTLPIYEIFKVGEELHWKRGLNFFDHWGLSLVFVPHWNNNDGGSTLDTSRCYLGQTRFAQMLDLLPDANQQTIVGIDEATALEIDLEAACCQVSGLGSITLLRDGRRQQIGTGNNFPIDELGPFHRPHSDDCIPVDAWQRTLAGIEAARNSDRSIEPPTEVLMLVEARKQARLAKDYARSDQLRDAIAALGWRVIDGAQGQQVELIP